MDRTLIGCATCGRGADPMKVLTVPISEIPLLLEAVNGLIYKLGPAHPELARLLKLQGVFEWSLP